MPLVRRLNSVGIARFEEFVHALKDQSNLALPRELLASDETSTALESNIEIEIEERTFQNRLESASYFDTKFRDSGLKNIDQDQELWSWLALFYFDSLCPPNAQGKRKPVQSYHYIPVNTDYRLYYRHLLASPYRIYRAHRADPQRALVFLIHPLDVVGHFIYQLASRQELVTNAAVVGAATQLYVDVERRRYKRGAVTRETPGSVFRFVVVLQQLDLTWDLAAMTACQLLSKLPSEFNRFKQGVAANS